jgi:protein-L-isoaspartate(D-aspartate) O-methyltransferase
MHDTELTVVRRAYAKQVLAAAEVSDARLETAFATVPREAFLGVGPWKVLRSRADKYVPTPDGDPVYLYVDEVVAICSDRGLNNGLPSLHAAMIASVLPRAGEHAVHIGTGGGYYTAILSALVGARGRITAIEVDPTLADLARHNLSDFANTCVIHGDGAAVSFEPADVIYVNAGASRPIDRWLDGLKDGGRLMVPLTTERQRGAAFRFERRGGELFARGIAPVGFFPCEGARDPVSEAALAVAFENERWREVTRLYRGADLPSGEYWLRAPGWCLAY